jgi:hypothetical protein
VIHFQNLIFFYHGALVFVSTIRSVGSWLEAMKLHPERARPCPERERCFAPLSHQARNCCMNQTDAAPEGRRSYVGNLKYSAIATDLDVNRTRRAARAARVHEAVPQRYLSERGCADAMPILQQKRVPDAKEMHIPFWTDCCVERVSVKQRHVRIHQGLAWAVPCT